MGSRTVSYGEFDELAGRSAPVAPGGAPLDTGGLDVIDTLAVVIGAARAGRPVIASTPGSAPLALGALPAGTFLVAVTSGTSGHPRAVARTLASWTDSFAPLAALAGLDPGDRVLLTGPLSSTLHLFAALHTLWLGAHLTDRTHDATAVHCVPTVLAELLDRRTARLRTVVVAGSALGASLAARAAQDGITVLEYYGAAELSFVAARRPPEAFRPFPGVEVRAADGLLWARSPYLALGYVQTGPDRGGPLRVGPAGFATVGDRGEVATDGTVRVLGRAESAITTGGSTILAEDVEAVIAELAGVRAVAAVGLPHPRLGQLLTAVVELLPGVELAAVRAAARQRLSGAGLPRRWLVRELPRTAGGKIARARLAAELAPTAVDRQDLPAGEVAGDACTVGDPDAGLP